MITHENNDLKGCTDYQRTNNQLMKQPERLNKLLAGGFQALGMKIKEI